MFSFSLLGHLLGELLKLSRRGVNSKIFKKPVSVAATDHSVFGVVQLLCCSAVKVLFSRIPCCSADVSTGIQLLSVIFSCD